MTTSRCECFSTARTGVTMTELKPPAAGRLKQFGLTLADWWACYGHQDGKCAICYKRFTLKRRPQMDHNHRTGVFRGLLCMFCNTELGYHHEDAERFYCAWLYLDAPPAYEIFTQPRIHTDARPR